MKRIAVLIDLTPICAQALEFANGIARKAKSELVLIHVSEDGGDKQVSDDTAQLEELRRKVSSEVKSRSHVVVGDFFGVIGSVITELEVELVVVPTHGKVGIMQNLFGAHILKLVKLLPAPSVVVQEGCTDGSNCFDTILYPVGPHTDFDVKYKQTATLAKLFGSHVVIYTVKADMRGVSEEILKNISASKAYFDRVGVKHTEVSEDPKHFSAGYAKHIINYAKENNMSSISIMARLSEGVYSIGNVDKENIILNELKLPVLCTNN